MAGEGAIYTSGGCTRLPGRLPSEAQNARCRAADSGMCRHPHDLLGNPISLLLILVAGLVHRQAGLQTMRRTAMHAHMAEVVPEARRPRRTPHLMDNGWDGMRYGCARSLAL